MSAFTSGSDVEATFCESARHLSYLGNRKPFYGGVRGTKTDVD